MNKINAISTEQSKPAVIVEFPFNIEQLDAFRVAIHLDRDSGQPIAEMHLHPALQGKIGDQAYERIQGELQSAVIREAIRVTHS